MSWFRMIFQRLIPTQRRERKGKSATMNIMMVALPVLAVVCYLVVVVKNPSLATRGLKFGGMGLLKTLPIIVAGFGLAGLLQVIEVRELVSSWLGAQRGFRGVLLGTLLGALTPGPASAC